MSAVWATSIVLQWVVIGLLCGVVVSMLRQFGALAAPVDASAPGTPVEVHEVHLIDEGTFIFGGVRPQPTLAVFLSPGCATCHEAAAQVRRLREAHGELSLLVVVDGEPEQARTYVDEMGLGDMQVALMRDFPARYAPGGGTPFALALAPGGSVAMRGSGRTYEELEELVRRASATRSGGTYELSIVEVAS